MGGFWEWRRWLLNDLRVVSLWLCASVRDPIAGWSASVFTGVLQGCFTDVLSMVLTGWGGCHPSGVLISFRAFGSTEMTPLRGYCEV